MTGRTGKVPRLPNGKYLALRDTAEAEARRIQDGLKAIDQLDQLDQKSNRRIDVSITSEVHTALRIQAATLDISITDLIQRILGHALGQAQKPIEQRPTDKRRFPVVLPIPLLKATRTAALLKGLSTSDYLAMVIRKGSA